MTTCKPPQIPCTVPAPQFMLVQSHVQSGLSVPAPQDLLHKQLQDTSLGWPLQSTATQLQPQFASFGWPLQLTAAQSQVQVGPVFRGYFIESSILLSLSFSLSLCVCVCVCVCISVVCLLSLRCALLFPLFDSLSSLYPAPMTMFMTTCKAQSTLYSATTTVCACAVTRTIGIVCSDTTRVQALTVALSIPRLAIAVHASAVTRTISRIGAETSRSSNQTIW